MISGTLTPRAWESSWIVTPDSTETGPVGGATGAFGPRDCAAASARAWATVAASAKSAQGAALAKSGNATFHTVKKPAPKAKPNVFDNGTPEQRMASNAKPLPTERKRAPQRPSTM